MKCDRCSILYATTKQSGEPGFGFCASCRGIAPSSCAMIQKATSDQDRAAMQPGVAIQSPGMAIQRVVNASVLVYSKSLSAWIEATITAVHPNGGITVNSKAGKKPKTFTLSEQATQLRPRWTTGQAAMTFSSPQMLGLRQQSTMLVMMVAFLSCTRTAVPRQSHYQTKQQHCVKFGHQEIPSWFSATPLGHGCKPQLPLSIQTIASPWSTHTAVTR